MVDKENNEKFCPFCGELLEESAKFCASCGQALPEDANNPGNHEERKDNPGKDEYDDEEDDEKTTRLRISSDGIKLRSSSDNDDSTVRLNISVPDSKRKEWKRLAATLDESVSELVREAMGQLQAGLTGAENLDEFGQKMEEWGKKFEKSIKKSGIGDIGKKVKIDVQRSLDKSLGKIDSKFMKTKKSEEELERIKKRIKGLIKLQGSVPIDKLSQALEISEEDAENMIYELAAEGVEGKLEESVFKYTSNEDEVISKLFKLIDQL